MQKLIPEDNHILPQRFQFLRHGRYRIFRSLHQLFDGGFQFPKQRIVCLDLSVDLTAVSDDTLRQETAEVAVERTGKAARTEENFDVVIGEMDRLDKNRKRRERYHEVLRGDVPLEYKTTYDGLIFPLFLSDPKQRLLHSGQFLDILYDCPYEMHELTGNTFLSKMVKSLKMDHKELLYYLSLHLYSTTRLAAIRGQSDRNIRKVRDTYTRKLQKKLYCHLILKRNNSGVLTLREKEFISLYEEALKHQSKTGTKVKRESKSPKRKKATTDNVSDG